MGTDHLVRNQWVSLLAVRMGVVAGAGIAVAVIGAGIAAADSTQAPDNSFTDWLLNPQDNLLIYEAGFSQTLSHAEGEFEQANTLLSQLPRVDLPEDTLTVQTQLDDGAAQLLQTLNSAENVLQRQADYLIPGGGLSVAQDFTVFNQFWDGLVGATIAQTSQLAVTDVAAGDSASEVQNLVSAIGGADQIFLLGASTITNDLIEFTQDMYPNQM